MSRGKGRVKTKVIDKIHSVRCGLRKYNAHLTIEATPDAVILADAKWGPITLILHLRLKPGEEGKDAWYAIHFHYDTAVKLICALARACAEAIPALTPRDVLLRAIKEVYEGRYARK